jgi:hypothetical protein
MAAEPSPPTMSTRPSFRRVAEWLSRPTVIEPVATNVPGGRNEGAIEMVGVAAVGLGMGVGWPVSGVAGPIPDALSDGLPVVPRQPISDSRIRPNAARATGRPTRWITDRGARLIMSPIPRPRPRSTPASPAGARQPNCVTYATRANLGPGSGEPRRRKPSGGTRHSRGRRNHRCARRRPEAVGRIDSPRTPPLS